MVKKKRFLCCFIFLEGNYKQKLTDKKKRKKGKEKEEEEETHMNICVRADFPAPAAPTTITLCSGYPDLPGFDIF